MKIAGASKYVHVHFRKSCNEFHVYMEQGMLLFVLLKVAGKVSEVMVSWRATRTFEFVSAPACTILFGLAAFPLCHVG
jgi:hypothetical protein